MTTERRRLTERDCARYVRMHRGDLVPSQLDDMTDMLDEYEQLRQRVYAAYAEADKAYHRANKAVEKAGVKRGDFGYLDALDGLRESLLALAAAEDTAEDIRFARTALRRISRQRT